MLWPFEYFIGGPGHQKVTAMKAVQAGDTLAALPVSNPRWAQIQDLFNPVAAAWQGEPISSEQPFHPSVLAPQPFILLSRQCVVKSVMRKEGVLGTVEKGIVKRMKGNLPSCRACF